MADQKITELTANTTPVLTDIIPIVDDPGGTPATQKITLDTLSDLYAKDFLFRQGFINGSCAVKQRADATLSTTPQYVVDRYAVYAGGTVGAGSITQISTAGATASPFAIVASGVTLTGSGTVIVRYRMESKDAYLYEQNSGVASFGCELYQGIGSACNVTITVNKANSADNFSAVTNIATSSNISVPNATYTKIAFENVTLGDCSNGIEVLVTVVTGAITTKDFAFTGFQMNRGSILLPFQSKSYQEEDIASKRYCYVVNCDNVYRVVGFGLAGSTTIAQIYVQLPVAMRIAPTLIATADNYMLTDNGSNTDVTALAKTDAYTHGNANVLLKATVASGLTQFRPYFLMSDGTAGRLMIFDAEL